MGPTVASIGVSIFTLLGVALSVLLAAYHIKYRTELDETELMGYYDAILAVLHLVIGLIHTFGIVTLWVSLERYARVSIIYAILSSITVPLTLIASILALIADDITRGPMIEQCIRYSFMRSRLGHLETFTKALSDAEARAACEDSFGKEIKLNVLILTLFTAYVLIATRLAWDRILTPGPIGKPDAEPILPSYRRRTSSNESAFPLRSLSASSFESSSSSELSLTLPKQALLDRPRPSYSSSASGGDTCPYFSPSYASSGVSDLVPAYTSNPALSRASSFSDQGTLVSSESWKDVKDRKG